MWVGCFLLPKSVRRPYEQKEHYIYISTCIYIYVMGRIGGGDEGKSGSRGRVMEIDEGGSSPLNLYQIGSPKFEHNCWKHFSLLPKKSKIIFECISLKVINVEVDNSTVYSE